MRATKLILCIYRVLQLNARIWVCLRSCQVTTETHIAITSWIAVVLRILFDILVCLLIYRDRCQNRALYDNIPEENI